MDGASGGSSLRLTDRNIGRAAAELLASQCERRKRGRPPIPNDGTDGEPDTDTEKRQRLGTGSSLGSVNVAAAKKAAGALLRESPTYKRLIETEERIDVAIMRKQQDIKDALKTHSYTSTRVFRLYLFNTYRAQTNKNGAADDTSHSESLPESDGLPLDDNFLAPSKSDGTKAVDDGDVPSWSLRIQGQLLPPTHSSDPGKPGSTQNPTDVSKLLVETCKDAVLTDENSNASVAFGTNDEPKFSADTSMNPAAPNHINAAHDSTPLLESQNRELAAASASQQILPVSDSDSRLKHGLSTPADDTQTSSLRCTEIFRRVVVELDHEVYPENNLIEWNRSEKETPADGFELSRAGDRECKVQVFVYIDHKPERFKLSFVLSRLIGVRTDSRSGVFMAVWQYIKKMKLQCVDDRTAIRIDQGLRTLLPAAHINLPVIKLQQLFEIIKMHMGPPDPIQIEYDIKLMGNVVDNQVCYDIQVEIPDEGLKESAQSAGIFGLTSPNSAEFVALNDKHLEALEQLAHHKRRRDFFESFCANPVEFIHHLILSQTRDLKVIAGSSGRNPEEERRASFYQQQWVHEAIPRYLLRKAVADAAKKNNDNDGDIR